MHFDLLYLSAILPTNVTSFIGYGTYLNTVTNSLFWTIILFTIFFMGVLSMRKFNLLVAGMTMGYSSALMATGIYLISWCNIAVPIIFASISLICTLGYFVSTQQ